MINKLYLRPYDILDELLQGNVEKIAGLVEDLGSEYRESYIPTLDEMSERDSGDFALSLFHSKHGELHKFACYTKELTALNLGILEKNRKEYPDEIVKTASTFLKKASDNFGIRFPKDLEEFVDSSIKSNVVHIHSIDKVAYIEKTSKLKTKEEYALKKKKKYPITTKAMCKKAADYFNVYYRDLNLKDRLEYAINLSEKMASFNMKVPKKIEKLANLDVEQVNPDLDLHIKSRKTMTNNEETKSLLTELEEKIGEWSPVKIASVLHKIDKNGGLDHLYDQHILDPLSASCGVYKQAEFEIDGEIYTDDSFSEMVNKDLSKYVDGGTAELLQSDDGVDVFRSLPSPVRKQIAGK
jgi:hypothetical protein